MKIIRLTIIIISLFIFNLTAFLVNGQTGCSINISTGVDSTGTLLSVGSSDPYWVCPTGMGNVLSSTPWDTLIGSAWLGTKTISLSDTTLTYTRSFTIPTGTTGGVIDLKSMADNYAEIYLDGVSIAKTLGTPSIMWGFRIINAATYSGAISSGSHILKARVYNESSITGLILKGIVTYKFLNLSSLDTTLCPGTLCTFKYDTSHTKFKWNDGDTNRARVLSTAGKYWRSSEKNCNFFIDSFAINYKIDTTFYALDTTLCPGTLCTFKYDTSHTKFKWNDGDTSRARVLSTAGKYWRSSEKNCNFFIDSFTLNHKMDTTFYALDTTLCPGILCTFKYDASHTKFKWYDGDTSRAKSFSKAGKYWRSSEKNCMFFIDSFTLNYTMDTTVNLYDTTLCPGTLCTFKYDASHTKFKWNDGDTSRARVLSTAGKYWRSSEKNCTLFIDSFTLTYTMDTTVNVHDTTLCPGTLCTFKYDASHTNFKWHDGDTSRAKIFSKSGKYWRSSEKGCMLFIDSFTLIHKKDTTFNAQDTALCLGASCTFKYDASHTNLKWYDGDTSRAKVFSKAGKYWRSSEKSCTLFIDSFTIAYKNKDTLLNTHDSILCFQSQLIISSPVVGGVYLWNDSSISRSNTLNDIIGKKWVHAIDSKNCKVQIDTFKATFINFNINIPDTAICKEQQIILDATTANATQYSWQDNSTLPNYIATKAGKYWVTVSIGKCKKTDTVEVVLKNFIFDLGNDTTLCKGETFLIESKVSNAQYLWQDGSRGANLLIKGEGKYSVIVTKDGCIGRDEIYVSYTQCNNCIAIPNAFTPNGDLVNDKFRVFFNCIVDHFTLIIYNRWGELVYQSEDYNQYWDGNFNSQPLSSGVYYYMIKVKFNTPGSVEEMYKGDVSLIR